MDWSKGFSAAYYAAIVDPYTWRDISRVEVTGGDISLSVDGLRGSADVDCVNYEQGRELWLRVWLNARQDDDTAHEALFTGLASSPTRAINGTLVENAVQLYSVLKPAEDVLLPLGWYAPEKTSGETLLRDLLSVTPAPVEFADNAPIITENIIAEANENRLTMVDKILEAMNWRLRITGDGVIHVLPKASTVTVMYDALDNDAVEPEIEVEHDWYSAPNVFRAVSGDNSETVYDESDSILSVENRGREIWAQDTSCNLNDGESLNDYARRRLAEGQQTVEVAKYDRRFNPELLPGDLVRLNYPRQKLTGVYVIMTQSITLGYGGTTSEEVQKYGEN